MEKHEMVDKLPDIENEIARSVAELKRADVAKSGNSGQREAAANAVLAACEKAVQMIRGVHETYASEGETLAQHLENKGKEYMELFAAAAKAVRELRIVPKEAAEATAKDLLELGRIEQERHAVVAKGLMDARQALLNIGKYRPGEREQD
jgi:hypothetical protein